MKKRLDPETAEAIAAIGRHSAHSPTFWWLYDNYTQIKKSAKAGRIDWSALENRAPQLGLKNGSGDVPSARNLRETFEKVERFKQSKAEDAAGRTAVRKAAAKPGPPPIARPPQVNNTVRVRPEQSERSEEASPTESALDRLKRRFGPRTQF